MTSGCRDVSSNATTPPRPQNAIGPPDPGGKSGAAGRNQQPRGYAAGVWTTHNRPHPQAAPSTHGASSNVLALPPGLAETEISIFANARDTSPQPVKLGAILNAIQDGRRADRIAHLRALLARGDKDTYDAQKKYLPAITLSGSFERRNAAGLIQHSGLLQADFDKLPNPEEVRDLLGADPHTVAAFLSPSAQGVKALVRIPDDPERHLASFRAAERHFRERYGLELDASCKDVSRLCFVSHDPDLCINPDAVPLKLPDPE